MIKNKNRITFLNIGSTVILQGLTFISGPIFSSILGPNNYGIAAVYLTWTQIASTVFSLQAASTIAQAIIYYPRDEQEQYQSSVLSLASLSYLCCSILTLLAAFLLKLNCLMVFCGLLQGWGLYCVTAMNGKFTYEFKADKNFILSVTVSILIISLSIILIYLFPRENNYWGRIIAQSVVYTLVGLFLFIYLFSKGKTFYNKTYWAFSLPIALPTIVHLLAHIVLGQSDKIMIQRLLSNSSAGIYALTGTFGAVLQTIYSALNNSWVPFYYDYTKNNQTEKIRKHARNYIELFTIITIGFILLSKEVFQIYAAADFHSGTDFLPLFSIGYYFVFLYSFPVNYEFYNKKTKTIAIGTGTAAVCNIILNFLLIKIIGIIGAVIATAIAHGLQFFFHYYSVKKMEISLPVKFPYQIKDFVSGFFAVCAACLINYLFSDFWYIRWSVGFLLGIYLIVKIVKRKEIF